MSSHLVGGIPTPLKNKSSSVGIIVPNMKNNEKQTCSKPLTSPIYIYICICRAYCILKKICFSHVLVRSPLGRWTSALVGCRFSVDFHVCVVQILLKWGMRFRNYPLVSHESYHLRFRCYEISLRILIFIIHLSRDSLKLRRNKNIKNDANQSHLYHCGFRSIPYLPSISIPLSK